MTADYRESHLSKGADYHAIFTEQPRLAMLWRLEQRALTQLVNDFFPLTAPAHLDFACGTGRVLSFLHGRAASSTGVDVSPSMMQVARQLTPTAEFVLADITRDPVLQSRRFDLITAFRFFPNAEPELRAQALESIARLLTPQGLLVFNNHLNRYSLTNRLVKWIGRDFGHAMAEHEVEALLRSTGLEVVRSYGFGLLPLVDRHIRWPRLFAEVEWTLSHFGGLKPLCTDILYVARRVARVGS